MVERAEMQVGRKVTTANGVSSGYEWQGVATLLAQDIQACLSFDFAEIKFGECVLLRKGDPMPMNLSLDEGWQYAVALHIRSDDRMRIMTDISQFNDAPVEPFLQGEYAVWQFPELATRSLMTNPRMATTVFLPKWLIRYLYNERQLTYRTDCEAVQYNLYADRDFSFQYLATYFPRTMAEVTEIFDYVFASNKSVIDRLSETVSILDVGCGSGAAAIALLWSLKKARPARIKKVTVIGLDGNKNFIDRFIEMVPTIRGFLPSVQVNIAAQQVSSIENALAQCPECHYDFVVSSKFIQELKRVDAYEWMLSACLAKVATGGTLLFLENYRRGRTECNCNLAKDIRYAHVEVESMKEFSIRQILEDTCVCETVGFQLLTNVQKEKSNGTINVCERS